MTRIFYVRCLYDVFFRVLVEDTVGLAVRSVFFFRARYATVELDFIGNEIVCCRVSLPRGSGRPGQVGGQLTPYLKFGA